MRVVTASQHHAQSIANIYRQAFPESAALFFRRVPETRLIQLLELTFSLLFHGCPVPSRGRARLHSRLLPV